jgi:uncharacterized protein YbjT (DUF2867 family)
MTPTILVVGATGNTGQNVIRTLPGLLKGTALESHRILAITRDAKSSVSQTLAKTPNVELVEKDWTTIDTAWLQSQNVTRAFIASHNMPTQFSDESILLVAMLYAGVEYVVRISTTHEVVSAATKVFYARTHWAIETMLSSPEFSAMQWTSLQPNVFINAFLDGPAQWVRDFKASGEQKPLEIILGKEDAVAILDPNDVGGVAAKLLAAGDTNTHNGKKYIIRGPENISGQDILDLVERYAGSKVESVKWRDTSMIDNLTEKGYPKIAAQSILATLEPAWEGKCRTDGVPTSEEVMGLWEPKGKVEDGFREMVEE